MTRSLDLKEALAAADNDVDLLQTLIELYFEQLPSLIDDIESGLQTQTAEKVERNAHSLKGAISVFGKHPACDAARNLERLSRESNWPAAQDAKQVLRAQLEILTGELHDLQTRLQAGNFAV